MKEFEIPCMPKTAGRTIRFPNDIIEKIEKLIVGKDCTFTAFVVAATRAVLEDLKEKEEKH